MSNESGGTFEARYSALNRAFIGDLKRFIDAPGSMSRESARDDLADQLGSFEALLADAQNSNQAARAIFRHAQAAINIGDTLTALGDARRLLDLEPPDEAAVRMLISFTSNGTRLHRELRTLVGDIEVPNPTDTERATAIVALGAPAGLTVGGIRTVTVPTQQLDAGTTTSIAVGEMRGVQQVARETLSEEVTELNLVLQDISTLRLERRGGDPSVYRRLPVDAVYERDITKRWRRRAAQRRTLRRIELPSRNGVFFGVPPERDQQGALLAGWAQARVNPLEYQRPVVADNADLAAALAERSQLRRAISAASASLSAAVVSG